MVRAVVLLTIGSGFKSLSAYMTQPIKKRTVTTSEYYDEEGRLTSKDVVEETEYETYTPSIQQWWQYPVISNGTNTIATSSPYGDDLI